MKTADEHDLYDETLDAIATEILSRDRKVGLANANRRARQRLDEAWQTVEGMIGVVSGKELIARLSGWSQQQFRAGFAARQIGTVLRQDELCDEIRGVVAAIEAGASFGEYTRSHTPVAGGGSEALSSARDKSAGGTVAR